MNNLKNKLINLKRRAEALPQEIDAWKTYAEEGKILRVHKSQIEVMANLFGEHNDRISEWIEVLSSTRVSEQFLRYYNIAERETIKVQEMWDFFRDLLEPRFVPFFAERLEMVDIIAADCYKPMVEKAQKLGLTDAAFLKALPLTFLEAGFSPATWRRFAPLKAVLMRRLSKDRLKSIFGESMGSLDLSLIPIPLIKIPWDRLTNVWSLLAVHHEVGHDVYFDLGLKEEYHQRVYSILQLNGINSARVALWVNWISEIFADVLGILFGGPAFLNSMIELLSSSVRAVRHINPSGPHPIRYLRVFINGFILRDLGFKDEARELEDSWIQMYGSPGELFNLFILDIPLVLTCIIKSKLQALRRKKLVDFVDVFTKEDHEKVIKAREQFLSDAKPEDCRPRHLVSAARLAFEKDPDKAKQIKKIFLESIKKTENP